MKWDVYCDLSAPVNLHSLIWDDGLVGLFNGQTAMRFRQMDDPVDLRDKHLVSPFLRREEDILYITSCGHVKVISGNTSLLFVWVHPLTSSGTAPSTQPPNNLI